MSTMNANVFGAARPPRRRHWPRTTGHSATTRTRWARRSGPLKLDPYQEIPWLILADLHEKVGDFSSAEYVRREHARIKADLEVSAT